MPTSKAIQFGNDKSEIKIKLSNHSDGERLPIAPNTIMTIHHSVINSPICGKVIN